MLQDVTVEHPPPTVLRDQADLHVLLRMQQHRIAPERLVDALAVAAEELEELSVEMHRVQAKRVVHESELAPLAVRQHLDVPRLRAMFGMFERFAIDRPLDAEGAASARIEMILGAGRDRLRLLPDGDVCPRR